ncbi:GumC family protein [Calothrix sp. 336/3]|uniref:GumC family protein n=1 Tax=Calothrix sp. 336/3 TaxID=1337936 RepID=UPI0004E2915D|nr:polysaccharide biosynthesis tyrosine autokinase [Calothrix sp. 336/3]AKG19988.1 hypothetical protein IJ00_00460 [Calothrix sp. 336/3]
MTKTSINRGKIVVASPQKSLGIKEISTTLQNHRFLIVGVSCAVISVTSLMALNAKPMYRSSMQILINNPMYLGLKSNNPSQEQDKAFSQWNQIQVDYTPQLRLMLSSQLMQRAIHLVHDDYPDMVLSDIKGENGQENPLELTAVTGKTEVNPAFGQVFELSFTSEDPNKSQKVLEALQKVYQDYNSQQHKSRLAMGMNFFSDRVPQEKQQLVKAEEKLAAFRKQHQVLDPNVQGKMLLESLGGVRKELQTIRARLQEIEARSQILQQSIVTSSRSHSSTTANYQALLKELQKTDLALTQVRQRYTDDYPAVQELIQQRQSQAALLEAEITQKSQITQKNALETGISKLNQELIASKATSTGLRAKEKSLLESEKQLSSELQKYPTLISEYNRLLPEVEIHRQTLEKLLQSQQSLNMQIAQSGVNWQILESPHFGTYAGSNGWLIFAAGLILGPTLGVTVALSKEASNQNIQSGEELKQLTHLPLLTTVPKLKSRRQQLLHLLQGAWYKSPADKLLHIYTALPVHEKLDMAYQNLQILQTNTACKSLLVTSATKDEGKTTVSLGLAVSAARMHRRVLVIDANLRQPQLHKTLDLSNDWGLSLLLVDEANTSIKDYIQPIHPAIDILAAGSTSEDVVKLLTSQRLSEVLHSFSQNYDLVIIDAPAILGTVDTKIIAALCDGIIMVGRVGQVSRDEVIQATEELRNLPVRGAIANHWG